MNVGIKPIELFHWNTDAYARAFETFLKCSQEKLPVYSKLETLFSGYSKKSRAVDWGAGSGNLTALLLEHFKYVSAIEPNAKMCDLISLRCPAAQVITSSMIDVNLSEQFDVGVLNHVLYHVPDNKWGAYIMHAAGFLTEQGILIVTLKNPDSDCNKMLEYFGSSRFDLYARLEQTVRQHKNFDFTFSSVPGGIKTQSFEDTLAVARFMLCDRDADTFSSKPEEKDFQDYVREHFWDDKLSIGGWSYDVIFCMIKRNPFY